MALAQTEARSGDVTREAEYDSNTRQCQPKQCLRRCQSSTYSVSVEVSSVHSMANNTSIPDALQKMVRRVFSHIIVLATAIVVAAAAAAAAVAQEETVATRVDQRCQPWAW